MANEQDTSQCNSVLTSSMIFCKQAPQAFPRVHHSRSKEKILNINKDYFLLKIIDILLWSQYKDLLF